MIVTLLQTQCYVYCAAAIIIHFIHTSSSSSSSLLSSSCSAFTFNSHDANNNMRHSRNHQWQKNIKINNNKNHPRLLRIQSRKYYYEHATTLLHATTSSSDNNNDDNDSTTTNESSSPIKVFDNVFSLPTCKQLHTLAMDHSKRSHDGSSLFYRHHHSSTSSTSSTSITKLTPLETALDTLLTTLNDTSPIVEYWSRPTYINMDAHADVDENALKEEGILRCPNFGHVLYLQIYNSHVNDNDNNVDAVDVGGNAPDDDDDKQKQRMGPTIVFPKRTVAWGTVSPRTAGVDPALGKMGVMEYIVDVENYYENYNNDDADDDKADGTVDDNDDGESNMNNNNKSKGGKEGGATEQMAIVPAMNGRLLRFNGDAFHAVPNPPDRYLLSDQQLKAFIKREEDKCEEDDDYFFDDDEYIFGDDYDDDYNDDDGGDGDGNDANPQQRSVILFNTWQEGSNGPRGVLPDCIVEAMPDGIAIDDDDDDSTPSYQEAMEAECWAQWRDKYGVDFEKVWCEPPNLWNHVDIDKIGFDATGMGNVTVPLMGNPSRRGVTQTQSMMKGPVVKMGRAFYESRKVSLVALEPMRD